MEKPQIDWRIIAIVVPCLIAYGIAAMHYGINGKFFAGIMLLIGLLLGLPIPSPFVKAKA